MTTMTIEETTFAAELDDTTPKAPEGYTVQDWENGEPLVWRGPTLSGVGGSWKVGTEWCEDVNGNNHVLTFQVEGTEQGDILLESDALDLAYAILAVITGGNPTDEGDRERFAEVVEYVRTRKADIK